MSANQDAFNQVLLIHSNCFKREVQIVQRNTNVHLIFHQLNLLHQIFHLACTQQIMALGHSAWKETRIRLQELLSVNNSEIRDNNELLSRYTLKLLNSFMN